MVSGKRSRAPSFSRDANTPPASLETRWCLHRPEIASIISSPDFDWEVAKQSSHVPMRNFLEQCRLCRKKLNSHIFMYGCFGAFCSPECREKQMAYDEIAYLCKRLRAKKGRNYGNNAEEKEDHAVIKMERRTAPEFHL